MECELFQQGGQVQAEDRRAQGVTIDSARKGAAMTPVAEAGGVHRFRLPGLSKFKVGVPWDDTYLPPLRGWTSMVWLKNRSCL